MDKGGNKYGMASYSEFVAPLSVLVQDQVEFWQSGVLYILLCLSSSAKNIYSGKKQHLQHQNIFNISQNTDNTLYILVWNKFFL